MSFYTGSALFIIFCVRALEIEAPGFLARPPCQGVQQFDFGVFRHALRLLLDIGFNFFQFVGHNFVGLDLLCLVLFVWGLPRPSCMTGSTRRPLLQGMGRFHTL